jgi:hypothetical protein
MLGMQTSRFALRRWMRMVSLALAPVLCLGGCASMNNTEKGALVGGGLGAGIGALAGKAAGNTAAGAAIGGATGALLGAAAGHSEDRHEREMAKPVRGPLSLQDVATLSQQGVTDDIIINQIYTTGSSYNLSASDIGYLKQYSVSDRVIKAMQDTRYARRRVYSEGPVVQERVVVVEPAPPPPAVGIGFTYRR